MQAAVGWLELGNPIEAKEKIERIMPQKKLTQTFFKCAARFIARHPPRPACVDEAAPVRSASSLAWSCTLSSVANALRRGEGPTATRSRPWPAWARTLVPQGGIGKTHRGHRRPTSPRDSPPRLLSTINSQPSTFPCPSALSNARSLAASTFTTLAEIKPALVAREYRAKLLNC